MAIPINKFQLPFTFLGSLYENFKNWINRYTVSNTGYMAMSTYYINGTYYAFLLNFAFFSGTNGDPKQCYTSTDGINWTLAGNIGYEVSGMAYGNGFFLFKKGSVSGSSIIKSTTGYNNFSISSTINAADSFLAFTNGVFFCAVSNGTNYTINTSTDGITWTARSATTSNPVRGDACYGNSTYVYYDQTIISTSTNLTSWTNRTVPSGTAYIMYISYINNQFIMVTNPSSAQTTTAYIYTSPDAITWTYKSSCISPISTAGSYSATLIYTDNIYIIAVSWFERTCIFTSSDLISWSTPTEVDVSGGLWANLPQYLMLIKRQY